MRWLALIAAALVGDALGQAPDKLAADIRLAEERGLALFQAYEKAGHCDGPHRKVTISGVVYRLAEGRCIGVEDPASASAGATRPERLMLANTQTAVPTGFHVFLSLKHDVPVFVATRAGTWKVEAGLITRIN